MTTQKGRDDERYDELISTKVPGWVAAQIDHEARHEGLTRSAVVRRRLMQVYRRPGEG